MNKFANGFGTAILIAALLFLGYSYADNVATNAAIYAVNSMCSYLVCDEVPFATTMAFAGEHSSLPKEMVGEWCYVKDTDYEYERHDCRGTDGTMTLGKHNVSRWEEDCDFTKVQQIDRNVYYVHGNCGGEGMTWKDSMIVQFLSNDRIRFSVITHSEEK